MIDAQALKSGGHQKQLVTLTASSESHGKDVSRILGSELECKILRFGKSHLFVLEQGY